MYKHTIIYIYHQAHDYSVSPFLAI